MCNFLQEVTHLGQIMNKKRFLKKELLLLNEMVLCLKRIRNLWYRVNEFKSIVESFGEYDFQSKSIDYLSMLRCVSI